MRILRMWVCTVPRENAKPLGDIAIRDFDAEGELIGFRRVHIQVGQDLVADCDIRD